MRNCLSKLIKVFPVVIGAAPGEYEPFLVHFVSRINRKSSAGENGGKATHRAWRH
jgi:hypothetical protein